MSAIEKIKAKARADVKHIVLPEGTEPRTVQASAKILKEGVARVTLLGNPDEVRKVARRNRHRPHGRRHHRSCDQREKRRLCRSALRAAQGQKA